MKYECDAFILTQDKSGKFWVWSVEEEINIAIRAKDEVSAYRGAISSLTYVLKLRTDRRDKAEKKLKKLEDVFCEVFEIDEADMN